MRVLFCMFLGARPPTDKGIMNSSNPFILAQDLTLALFVHGPVEAAASFFRELSVEYFLVDPEPSHCDGRREDRQIMPPSAVDTTEVPTISSAVHTAETMSGESAGQTAIGSNESIWLRKTFSANAGVRDYWVYVPASYRREPLPMIVMLHGANQDSEDFAIGTRMNVLAEEARYIIVYPEQPQSANPARCWNWFRPVDQMRESGEPSLIAGITREVMSTYNVDPARVYVAGMSAGGAMAVNLAVTHTDLYAAAGIHSGLPYGIADDAFSAMSAMNHGTAEAHFPLTPNGASQVPYIPLIVFHGDQDNVVHPRNSDDLMGMSRVAALASESARAHVTTEVAHAEGVYGHTRSLFNDATGEIAGEQWMVHGLGHAWSGGDSAGTYTDSNGPNASREMLRFFGTVKITSARNGGVPADAAGSTAASPIFA